MAPNHLLRKRVSVLKQPHLFVVAVDADPILTCTVRREAMRYAVLIRRALQRGRFGSSSL